MLPTATIIEAPYQAGSSASSQKRKAKKNNHESDDEGRAAFTVRASLYDFTPITADSERKGKAFLNSEHWASGLQASVLQSVKKIPLRFFIVDDSGSMATVDGNRSVKTTANSSKHNMKKMIKCTRWSELTASLRFHVALADAFQAPTEFRFLNLNNSQPILVGDSKDTRKESMGLVLELLDESPSGQTPLCRQVDNTAAAAIVIAVAVVLLLRLALVRYNCTSNGDLGEEL
jgi:hypothetical protein